MKTHTYHKEEQKARQYVKGEAEETNKGTTRGGGKGGRRGGMQSREKREVRDCCGVEDEAAKDNRKAGGWWRGRLCRGERQVRRQGRCAEEGSMWKEELGRWK